MYDTRDDPMSDVPLPADWYESHVMGAADPLWQWDVHSDRIVLSPEAARLLRSSLRSTDCVARLGGDEFAVLLPRCNLRDAARVLEKIRAVFRHYNEHSGNVPVIMSFGLSGAEEAPSLREALALADRRMLHEKHGSRLVSGHAIKAWIEKRKDCVVSLEESRYDG